MILEYYCNDGSIISEDAYAWRYLSLEFTIDFLESNSIHFSRLDLFEDKFEGLPLSIKSYFLTAQRIKLDQSEEAFNDFKKDFDKLKNKLKEEVDKWQKVAYSSCWYLTENKKHYESLAMWRWKQSFNSFVIKLKLKDLLELLKETLITYQSDALIQAFYGKVAYLSLHQHDDLLDKGEKVFPQFIKQNVYSYENELRLILLGNEKCFDIEFFRIKLKQSILNKIEIIAHPNITKVDYKKAIKNFFH